METEGSAQPSTHGAPTIAETALQLTGRQSPNPSRSHPLRGSDLLYIHSPQVASLNGELSRLLIKDTVNTRPVSVSGTSGSEIVQENRKHGPSNISKTLLCKHKFCSVKFIVTPCYNHHKELRQCSCIVYNVFLIFV